MRAYRSLLARTVLHTSVLACVCACVCACVRACVRTCLHTCVWAICLPGCLPDQLPVRPTTTGGPTALLPARYARLGGEFRCSCATQRHSSHHCVGPPTRPASLEAQSDVSYCDGGMLSKGRFMYACLHVCMCPLPRAHSIRNGGVWQFVQSIDEGLECVRAETNELPVRPGSHWSDERNGRLPGWAKRRIAPCYSFVSMNPFTTTIICD